jgi:hypothetical protein
MAQHWLFSGSLEERESSSLKVPRRRPIVVVNPSNDVRFREIVDRFVATGGSRPDDLEVALRTRYPAAVVRPRELAGERFEVWYVYRDGHWIRSEADVRPR